MRHRTTAEGLARRLGLERNRLRGHRDLPGAGAPVGAPALRAFAVPVSVSAGTLAREHATAGAAHQTATRVVRTSGPGQRVETTVVVPAALSLALLRALRWALDRARYRAGESEWARGDTARRWRGR